MSNTISLESLMTWDSYFRKYVNRREASLLAPRIFPIEEFKLSKGSVIHYLPSTFTDNGPSIDDPLFKGVTRNISSYYIDHLETLEGNPKILTVAINSEIRKYHAENRKIRRVFDLSLGLKDIESPLIVNYCYLNRKYKYLTNPKKDWYYNNNLINTIVKNMNDVYRANNNSNQFLFVELPNTVPSLPFFNAVNKQESQNYIQRFNTFTKVLLLHIFNSITGGNESSRHAFNDINKRVLDKINIVFVESGFVSILNIGTMLSWVKTVENTNGKNPRIIKLYFIRFLLSLMKIRTSDIDELIERAEEIDNSDAKIDEILEDETDYTISSVKDKEETIDNDLDDDDSEVDNKHKVDVFKEDKKEEKEIDKSIKLDTNTDTFVYDYNVLNEKEERELKLLEEQLDKQLNNLEEDIVKREIKQVKASQSNIFDEEPLPLEEEILYQIDDLMEMGLMSPTDYVKFQNLSNSYKSIKVEDKTLEEFIDIKKEDIVVKEVEIPDNPIIKNKDMLKSTLIDMNKKYVEEVLQRDIASMVVNIQRGGVCVTDYKVVETEDSSGRFNNYEVKIIPIKGKASTIKFKLPVIDEEGNYKSGNSDYRLRSQIVDIPIRKISPTRVALTSSYGKVFIERSERKAFNYQKWLCNNIRAASLDKNNSRIVDSRTGDVFDPNIKLPFVYTTIAKEFRTFTANNIFFYFDYHKRIKRFGDIVIPIEQNGRYLVCGKKDDNLVVMDIDSNLFEYISVNNQYSPLPTMEEICGLDYSHSPVSIAEVNIRGRTIPVGIVLAYRLGFSNLVKLLGVEHKIITDYRGVKVEDDEYSISFKDKRYVFKKKDRIASLILNGFNAYKGEISDFNQEFFDRKDVYFNILDTKKVADRYLREIDLLFNMFIDPITLRILEDLNEPKTFRGLLLKSCQLLSTDDHEDEVSGYGQRIRGYEKMASLVYSELVNVIRSHNNKSNNHLSQITINPNDILLKFLNDPGCVKVNGLNPFQNMRQIEAVTYTGTGGRNKDTMVKRTRKYHEGSIGVISEATVDSGDVGINIYTSANPQFNTVYGTTTPTTDKARNGEVNTVQMMSSVFNTMPAIEKDDQIRSI